MTTLYLRKLYDKFIPVDIVSAEAIEKMPSNTEFKAEMTRPRNLGYHKKFFAMISVAYEAWEMPVNEYKGQPIQKDLERFRKDLLILAGYGYPVVNIRGEVRYEAQSMAFGSMDQQRFEEVYSRVIDVILGKVLTHYTQADLEDQINRILGFC